MPAMPPGNVNPDTSGMGGSVNPSLLIPKRNQRLIDRITGAIFRSQPQFGPQPAQQQTTQSGVTVQALQSVFDQYFRSQSDRLAVYKDADEMDNVSEEISVALDTIADNVTTSEDGVQMTFSVAAEDLKVQDVLEQVNTAANLHRDIYSIVRNLVKYGDGFGELVVNAEAQITQLRQLPPSTMFRNQDNRGDLVLGQPKYDEVSGKCLNEGGQCAYEQRAEDTQAIVAAFWPWQVVHIRLNHDGFKPYGRSHLRVARITWKKLKAIEEAMIIARLARAYPKYKFLIDTTGRSPAEATADINTVQQAVNQRQAIDGRREQPYWILSDIYMGVPQLKDSEGKLTKNSTDVSVLESQSQSVYNIDDIKSYFHRKLLCCLRIPPAHMGWEEQVNAKATVSAQDVQYIRFLRRLQQLVGQALEQIYDTALVLQGMDPSECEYEITWPMLSATDEAAAADAEFSRAQADNLYAQLGAIDAEWIQMHRLDWTDEEIEEFKERMDEVNQAAAQAAGGDDYDEDYEEGGPEDKENEGREIEHPAVHQAWSPAARRAASTARRKRGGGGGFSPKARAAAAAARRVANAKRKAAGVKITRRKPAVIQGEGQVEPTPQQQGALDRASVSLLSGAIKARAQAQISQEVERVLEEQRDAYRRSRALGEGAS